MEVKKKRSKRQKGQTKWAEYRRKDLFSLRSTAEKAANNIITRLGYKTVLQRSFFTGRKTYFADIYIPSLNTVVEIDGGYHMTSEQRRLDKNRTASLRRLGVKHILRLTNREAKDVNRIATKLMMAKTR